MLIVCLDKMKVTWKLELQYTNVSNNPIHFIQFDFKSAVFLVRMISPILCWLCSWLMIHSKNN